MKILIVDDEYYARKALQKIIVEWDNSVKILEAENGQEALDVIQIDIPDIVFSDIRMPDLDGIEFAKVINERYPSIYTVIISGYAEFQYAQSAINYQVKHYLLKPIKKTEIICVLEKFKDLMEKDLLEKENANLLKDRLDSDMIEKKLNSIIYGSQKVDTGTIEQLGLNASFHSAFFVVVIQSNIEMDAQIKNFIEDSISDRNKDIITFLSNKYTNELIMIKFCEFEAGLHGLSEPNEMEDDLKILMIKTPGMLNVQLAAALSICHGSLEELPEAYREASYSLNYKLINGWRKIYDYKNIRSRQKYGSLLDSNMQELFYINLHNGNFNFVKDCVRKMFQKIENTTDLSISAIQDMVAAVVLTLNRVLKEINDAEDIQRPYNYIENIELNRFISLSNLLEWMLIHIENVCSFADESRKSAGLSIIEELKKYLSENYNHDISLEDLAKSRYFVNPSYLSRLFKSETGSSFSNYLTGVRMNKAKELIKNHNLVISDIANLVGYSDLSYFIKIFKAYFGKTPGQYKTQIYQQSKDNPTE